MQIGNKPTRNEENTSIGVQTQDLITKTEVLAREIETQVIPTFKKGLSRYLGILSTIGQGIYFFLIISIIPTALRFLTNLRIDISAGYLGLFLAVMTSYGFYQAMKFKTIPLIIKDEKLTKEKNLVFISDIHVNSYQSSRFIKRILKYIEKLKPEAILIGGDLLNEANPSYLDALLPFNKLDIPIYAVLGNHDIIGGKQTSKQISTKTKIKTLRNETSPLGEIEITGIDDKHLWGEKTLNEVLDESYISQDTNTFKILISHQPIHLKKLEKYDINLALSGHTHNGQFFPFSMMIKRFNDYTYGKYQEGKNTAFVSQGVGTRGLPFRLGTHSEIVHIKLQPKT